MIRRSTLSLVVLLVLAALSLPAWAHLPQSVRDANARVLDAYGPADISVAVAIPGEGKPSSLAEILAMFDDISGGLPHRFASAELASRPVSGFRTGEVTLTEALLALAEQYDLAYAVDRSGPRPVLVIRPCSTCSGSAGAS